MRDEINVFRIRTRVDKNQVYGNMGDWPPINLNNNNLCLVFF